MTLRDLKNQIAQLEQQHGDSCLDLEIATVELNDYWGTVLNTVDSITIEDAQIDGPKKPARKCAVIT